MTKEQFESITEWQDKTFGSATTESKFQHLLEEIIELADALTVGDAAEIKKEFADCFILLFGAANSAGMTYDDICETIDKKMKINRSRVWGKPEANGVVHHVKSESDEG